jgi:hypothetical protein
MDATAAKVSYLVDGVKYSRGKRAYQNQILLSARPAPAPHTRTGRDFPTLPSLGRHRRSRPLSLSARSPSSFLPRPLLRRRHLLLLILRRILRPTLAKRSCVNLASTGSSIALAHAHASVKSFRARSLGERRGSIQPRANPGPHAALASRSSTLRRACNNNSAAKSANTRTLTELRNVAGYTMDTGEPSADHSGSTMSSLRLAT